MKAILTNETINILGGQKNMDSASEETSRFEASHKETKSERFKRIWGGILNVAEDIKEKIIPIVEPVGKVISSLITAVAVFRNSKRRYATGRMV